MTDDRLSRENERELFEAIVADLPDPEVVQFRRIFLLLGVTVYVAAVVALTFAGGFGWAGVIGFSATFVPGMVMAWRRLRRRFSVRLAGA
jgi:hypothetical protein